MFMKFFLLIPSLIILNACKTSRPVNNQIPNQVDKKTGRVHTDYMQTVAATGRLSSNNPNLQNIPIRTERGRQIRKAFIARDEDYTLLSADYSQIELRIIAALCGEENMIKAFQNHETTRFCQRCSRMTPTFRDAGLSSTHQNH